MPLETANQRKGHEIFDLSLSLGDIYVSAKVLLKSVLRKVVGTTAKKFASIVRFNSVLDNLTETKSLIEICYENNNFFDQAHFIKAFNKFTGDTHESSMRFL
jgi:AraC-like DNA-binding protein